MKYYCIGIKGTGMSTLAQILHDLGNEVSGYESGCSMVCAGIRIKGVYVRRIKSSL